jgi:cellulose synthase/poly-beta-1,6-N-acetylglucosamine synthase-like glycosyltransferase
MTIFFLIGGLIFLALAAHPFTTYPLSLLLLKRWRLRPLRPAERRQPYRYAVCVAAYNEASVIRRKAENLLDVRRKLGQAELLVYVDGASDDTAIILGDFASEIDVVVSAKRSGKSAGMNALLARATADIVIFTDANAIIDIDGVGALSGYFDDPKVGCVCGHLVYGGDAHFTQTAHVGSAYWRLEEHIKQLESDTGSAMGADGALFAIRRELYRPVREDVIDDMFTSISILCDGYRVVRAEEFRAWEPPTTRSDEEFRRKVRISCRAFNAHRLLWKRLRNLDAVTKYKYLSHKLLRWFSGMNLMIAAFFAWALLASLIGFWISLGLAAVTLSALTFLYASGARPIRLIGEILFALIAASFGVVKSLQGERFQTWTPPASTRKPESP